MIMKSRECVMLLCHLEYSISAHLHRGQSKKKGFSQSGTGVFCKLVVAEVNV